MNACITKEWIEMKMKMKKTIKDQVILVDGD